MKGFMSSKAICMLWWNEIPHQSHAKAIA